MKLGVKKLHSKAQIPEFQTEDAACFDLVAVDRVACGSKSMIYSTGLAFEIPKGYCIEVYSRSGHGFRDDLRLANTTGIIDADYTGEVKVKLTFDGPSYSRPSWPMVGDRIAQAKLVRLVKTEFIEIEELKETERGDKGFGSTGQ